MTKRLFFALELPAYSRAALAEIDPQLRNVKWVAPEKMHLTLSFLGNVEEEQQESLLAAAREIHVPRFFLPLRGVGTFGGSRPSVIWAGVGQGHPHLFALYKHVQDAVLRAGLEPELRSFHPHVTLARLRGVPAAALKPFLRQHVESDFGLWEAKELVLFSSRPHAGTSSYSAEWRQPLE